MRTRDRLLAQAAARLDQAGIDRPRYEARLLLAWATGRESAALPGPEAVSPEEERRFLDAVARRASREPLAFITGETGFWTLDLRVSPATLIPRADSESLIEALLALRPDRQAPLSVLDLGTGTGCLLLAALSEYPNAVGIGVDLAPGAAALARENARANGLAERAAFMAGNWAEAIGGTFDVVLSNPPYIESADIAGLMPEVALHEPARALDGGTDGLDAYRALTARLPTLLREGGLAVIELGAGQGDAVSALAAARGLREAGRRKDLGGIERAIMLEPDPERRKSLGWSGGN